MGLTILDIAKRNGSDAVVGLIDETTKAVPEVSGINPETGIAIPGVGDARTITGTSYKTLIRVGLPTVGFRNGNEGSQGLKSRYENKLVETFIMNPRWDVDKAIADKSEDGWQVLMADEAGGILEAAFQQLGRQFYYGRNTAAALGGHAKGFGGLIDVVDAGYIVDAGGTTADTGTSVWAVKFGPKAVRWVYGANGSMDPTEVDQRDMRDADQNPYTAYFQEMFMYPGLQVGSARFIARIKKLTEDSGKGLTDARMAALLEKFPVGIRPDAFFMTKRSRRQLRDSRTATNDTGKEAPLPTDYEGIPIVVTESISNTEPLTL
jgi:hypothetical protein